MDDADQALKEFEAILKRGLGQDVRIACVTGLPVPMSMACIPYQTARRVRLYRVAFVLDGQFYAIDCMAPLLSDPDQLPSVLRTVLGTLKTGNSK